MDANRKAKQMGVLVVGLGFLGSLRATSVRQTRGARLVAVFDSDTAVARRESDRLRVPAVGSLNEGLDMDDVDVVIVSTPNADHDDAIRRSLDAGKHVLCEKPLTIDPDEGRELAQRADEMRLRLGVAFNHRFYPPVRDALTLVADWAIGRVESVRATIGHRASAEFLAGWHADRAVSGGGTLIDNGPHACDIVRKFLGEIGAAQGYTRDSIGLSWGIESEAFAQFRNHERGVAEVRSSWTLEEGYFTIEVRGSGGFLRVETAPWRLSGRIADGSRVERRYFVRRAYEKMYERLFGCETSLVSELEDFLAWTRGEPLRWGATAWDGCRVSEMIDSVYRAAAGCSEVLLSPPIVHTPHSRLVARGVER